MNIIIDTNTINYVFDRTSVHHKNYKPILDCITNRTSNHTMIYGGDKFLKELRHFLKKYAKLLSELRNLRKIEELPKDKVNKLCVKIKKIEPCKDFDDEHLIACIILGKCKLVVTEDSRSHKYIKDENGIFYSSPKDKPSIYFDSRMHCNLLTKN